MAFGKNRETRISDTLQFIRNDSTLGHSRAKQQAAADYFESQLKKNFTDPAFKEFLDKTLSQEDNPTAGDETTRKYRRACILAGFAFGRIPMNAPVLAGKYRKTGLLSLKVALAGMVEEGYLVGPTSATALSEVLIELKAHPAAFLKKHVILIYGSKQAGVQKYRISYSTQSQQFMVKPHSIGSEPTGSDFEAISVPALNWHTYASYDQIEGVELTNGADFMATTQFTGCSLCYKVVDGGVYVAHVSPDGTNSTVKKRKKGDELARELLVGTPNVKAGNFKNAPAGALNVYGRGGTGLDGYSREVDKMYVLGIRGTGGWALYSQHKLTDGSIKVYRLHPGVAKQL